MTGFNSGPSPSRNPQRVQRGGGASPANVRCRDQDQINPGETSPRLVLRIARRPAPARAVSYLPFQADELHQAGRVRCARIVAQGVSASWAAASFKADHERKAVTCRAPHICKSSTRPPMRLNCMIVYLRPSGDNRTSLIRKMQFGRPNGPSYFSKRGRFSRFGRRRGSVV